MWKLSRTSRSESQCFGTHLSLQSTFFSFLRLSFYTDVQTPKLSSSDSCVCFISSRQKPPTTPACYFVCVCVGEWGKCFYFNLIFNFSLPPPTPTPIYFPASNESHVISDMFPHILSNLDNEFGSVIKDSIFKLLLLFLCVTVSARGRVFNHVTHLWCKWFTRLVYTGLASPSDNS